MSPRPTGLRIVREHPLGAQTERRGCRAGENFTRRRSLTDSLFLLTIPVLFPVGPQLSVSVPTADPAGQQLGPTLHIEVPEDHLRVPVHGVPAHPEALRDLL